MPLMAPWRASGNRLPLDLSWLATPPWPHRIILLDEMEEWLADNIAPDRWWFGDNPSASSFAIVFTDDADAALFKLRWG